MTLGRALKALSVTRLVLNIMQLARDLVRTELKTGFPPFRADERQQSRLLSEHVFLRSHARVSRAVLHPGLARIQMIPVPENVSGYIKYNLPHSPYEFMNQHGDNTETVSTAFAQTRGALLMLMDYHGKITDKNI